MSTEFTLEQLLNATDLVVIGDVEVNVTEFCIAGDKDCAAFHMANDATLFFDPEQKVTLDHDGQAKIQVTPMGEKTRTEVTALLLTHEKLTTDKVQAKIGQAG